MDILCIAERDIKGPTGLAPFVVFFLEKPLNGVCL